MSMTMSRRSFGLGLISGLAGLGGLPFRTRTAEAKPLMDVAIAGGRYHALKARRASLPAGRLLKLAREPENPFDPNAVAILDADGIRLGYVPRAVAGEISALMDAGRHIEAEIVGRLSGIGAALPRDVASTDPFPGDPRIRLSVRGTP